MFQSTRPVRGATSSKIHSGHHYIVSIHAPRAGRDNCRRIHQQILHVSIHAPRAGRDNCRRIHQQILHVSIHAPRAGRDVWLQSGMQYLCVSIHAPRAGRDIHSSSLPKPRLRFNPRAPCGARRQKKLRLPSFATYLWVLLATNMIFSMSEQHTLLSCAAST